MVILDFDVRNYYSVYQKIIILNCYCKLSWWSLWEEKSLCYRSACGTDTYHVCFAFRGLVYGHL